jgi:hypothetical protein
MIRSVDNDRACSLGNRRHVKSFRIERPAGFGASVIELGETLFDVSGIQPKVRAYRLHSEAAFISSTEARNGLAAELRSLV